jgi:hypothetical protein
MGNKAGDTPTIHVLEGLPAVMHRYLKLNLTGAPFPMIGWNSRARRLQPLFAN